MSKYKSYEHLIKCSKEHVFYYDIKRLFYEEDYIDEVAPPEKQHLFNSMFKFLFWNKEPFLKSASSYSAKRIHKTRMMHLKFPLHTGPNIYYLDFIITSRETPDEYECPSICVIHKELNLVLNFILDYTYSTIATMDKVVVALHCFISLMLNGASNIMLKVKQ
jgi:hypothetical protein